MAFFKGIILFEDIDDKPFIKDLFFGGATVIEIGDAVKKTIKQKEQKEKIVQTKIQEEAKLPI